jgi:hypothetical protein
VKTEREDENEQNDDISDRTEGYTTTKTDKVDEHGHDKAKTYEPKTDKIDEHGHDKAKTYELKTDKVDEHGHDKAKTYEPKTDKVDEHGHDKTNKCEPTTTTQVKLKLLKNKAMQMMTMNKIK